jgi:trimethylamine--corrinoid protein Co-methyltransferase
MQIQHEEAAALLLRAGCKLVNDKIFKIPEKLIIKAIRSAPSNIPIYDREGNRIMDIGGRRSYFGTGSDLLYALDVETMKRRPCILNDVSCAARLCDVLPNINFIISCAHPSDIDPNGAYLTIFQAMFRTPPNRLSVLPIVETI